MMTFLATLKSRFSALLHKPVWGNYNVLLLLWMLVAVGAWIAKRAPERGNNFLIFKGVFWHTLGQLPLYVPYPQEYGDVNHYGPLFSLIIAPFALAPHWLGLLGWMVCLALLLYAAVRYIPARKRMHVFIFWFCAHELLTALFMMQFNVAVAALIILSYAALEREKEWFAALMIVIGTFVKLYGVVGLAFFFFSKHKIRFVVWGVVWSVAAFCLPMLLSGPEYICSQYVAWFQGLASKGAENLFSLYQNVSLLGMIRKISGCAAYSDLWPILGGLTLFALPYLRVKQYRNAAFRLTLLASVLLFVVLFSTGSESSSYIIALCGASIWYTAAPWKRSGWDIALMVFTFVLTSLSPSDIFPVWVRQNVILPYALKALPCALIWFKLIYEMCTRDYEKRPENITELRH